MENHREEKRMGGSRQEKKAKKAGKKSRLTRQQKILLAVAVVLAVVALGVPAVYFWTFFHSLSLQIKKMGLPRPFYRLLLDDEGLSVWMAGEQDKPEASRKYAWHDMHLAYRTPNAIYLYVQQNQAYLLNDSLDAAWSLLQASLPAERLHDMR